MGIAGVNAPKFRKPLLATIAVMCAFAAAPLAEASGDRSRCNERAGASVCQKPGHASLHAEPRGPSLTAPPGRLFDPSWAPGFGRGFVVAR